MAKDSPTLGASFANSALGDTGAGIDTVLNPYAAVSPMPRIGLDNLMATRADNAVLAQGLTDASGKFFSQFTQPPMAKPAASVYYNASTQKFNVNGAEFAADNDAAALQTEARLGQPGTGAPTGEGWVRLDPAAYANYLNTIKNPGLGKLAKKNFGIGVDNMQLLAGYGLQFAGAEETGKKIVEQQVQDLGKSSPYQREFTDIGTQPNRGVLDWFVANLAQQGPNIIESAVTATLGAIVGGAAGGGPNPFTAAGGALAALSGKEAVKQSVLAAAKKYARGEALDAAETKLMHEMAGITAAAQLKSGTLYAGRGGLMSAEQFGTQLAGEGAEAALKKGLTQARVGGAATASLAQNYATGVADIYGEQADAGAQNRSVAALLGIPYAALETLPEFLLASRIFGGIGGKGAPSTATTRMGRAGDVLKRGGTGAVVGGISEGGTEAGQEALLLAANPDINWDSPEGMKRLVNSFAAGFGVGGPIGAGANIFGKRGEAAKPIVANGEETNLLDRKALPPPTTPLGGTGVPPSTPPALPGGGGQALGLPAPTTYLPPDQSTIVGGAGELPSGPGTQAVLPIFGNEVVPIAEMRQRMSPPAPQVQPTVTPAAPVVDPRQGALQFSTPLPGEGQGPMNTQMADQLQQLQLSQQRQQQFDAAQNQRQQEIQQQLDQLAKQSQNARDIYAMNQQQAGAQTQPAAAMPMVNVPQPAPRQLPLFNRRQAPVPSRAEGLRRGVGTQPIQRPTEVTPRVDLRTSPQMSLFTQEGQPTVAALKSAGTRQQVAAPVIQQGAAQIPPTGKAVNPLTIAKAFKDMAKKAAKTKVGIQKLQAKEKANAVQERSAKGVDVQKPAEAGKGVRGENKAGDKAAEKGQALKAKKQEPTVQDVTPPTEPTPPKGGKPKAKAPAKKTEAKGAAAPKAAGLKKGAKAQAAAAVEVEAYATPMEAWDDMRPETAGAYESLPAELQTRWTKAVADNRATMSEAQKIADEAEDMKSPMQLLQDEIAAADAATDVATFRAAMDTVVFHAFFDSDPNNKRDGVVAAAQEYISNTEFTEGQRRAIDDSVVEQANERQKLEAAVKKGEAKGELRPWFAYAEMRNLIPRVRNLEQRVTMLPEKYKTKLGASIGEKITSTGKNSTTTEAAMPWHTLENLIDQVLNGNNILSNKTKRDDFIAKAQELYAVVMAAGKEAFITGRMAKLSDFFTKDGTLKGMYKTINGHYIPLTKVMSTEQQQARQAEEKATARALAEEQRRQDEEILRRGEAALDDFASPSDWDTTGGMFYRDDGSPQSMSIPIGKIRLLMNSFLSRFKVKPKAFVYTNVADLKEKNPSLYAKAAAARTEGDFDTTNAAGYSFGGTIIIFSDFIRSERQLGFILAHESLGHFGFKAIMDQATLKKMLDSVYASSNRIRNYVDYLVETKGMSRLEATEEFLADLAGELDTSLIAKVWTFVKNALNKLGLKFEDDAARMMVSQARRYLRTGNAGIVSGQSIADRMAQLEKQFDGGRYAESTLDNFGLSSTYVASASLNKLAGRYGGFAGATEFFRDGKVRQYMQGQSGGFSGWVARTLEKVQTLDNMATRSEGLSRVFHIFQGQSNKARALLSHYNFLTQLTHSAKVTSEDKDNASKLLAYAALFKGPQATEKLLRQFPHLVTVDQHGNIMEPDPRVIEDLMKAGTVTAEEFRKGFEFTDALGNKQKFQFDVDEKSDYWKIYLEQRRTVAQAAIDVMMSNYEASAYEQQAAIRKVGQMRGAANMAFSAEDLQTIKRIARTYREIQYEGVDLEGAGIKLKKESSDKAERFLIAVTRALHEQARVKDWTTQADDEFTSEFNKDPQYAWVKDAVGSLNAKGMTQQQTFKVQKAIRDLFLFDMQTQNSDYYAKRTILGSYAPLVRRGRLQVKLTAYDEKGNVVRLADNVKGVMPYFRMDDKPVANDIQANLAEMFEGKTWTLEDEDGQPIKVTLKAEQSVARQTPDLAEAINYNEFIYVLNRLNVNLEPRERQRVVEALTAQNEAARRNLQRTGNPGWDTDVIRSVSEYLETSAHVAAKKIYRHRLDDVMANSSLWLGDDNKLRTLKAAVDNAKNEGDKAQAQREYDRYAYMYKYMKAEGAGNTVEINGKQEATLGRGETYREEAKKLIRWHGDHLNITDSTEDILSSEVGSTLKMLTVLMQLGGSVATALLNVVSLVTHSWTFSTFYNSERGYGLGFGGAKSATALAKALGDVKNTNFSDPAFIQKLLDGTEKNTYGLTEDELVFLRDQTEQGTLQAAAFDALLGTARGKIYNNQMAAGIKGWMYMFSYTEQLNRRVTALAAYRLEKQRQMAEGRSEEDAIAAAIETGKTAVNTSQGEYAMYNRPEMARGNVLQYVFMYKQFVIISTQLMKGLPPAGRVAFLGILLMMSGLKGLPFADDLMDLVDTLAQKFGIKMGSVESELYRFFDEMIPGSAPYFMRGGLDRLTGATISTRLGMGDMIPLSGVFRAGADPWREAEQFLGPVASGLFGIFGMGSSIAKYGAEAVGLKADVTSITDILRDSPVAMARALGDTLAYADNGAITNAQGKMVSKDVTMMTYITRMLGFYPAIATQQNDIVRAAKITDAYAKEVKAEFTAAYVKAAMANNGAGDPAAVAAILQQVGEWNDAAEGTGLQLRSFQKSANRALREANRPTAERYLKTAPVGLRPEVRQLLNIHGITDEDLRGM